MALIKEGIYKEESTNQRMFCIKVCSSDTIKTWFEDKQGNHDTEDNNWWDINIGPERFRWLIDEWNIGNIQKTYPHWWEKVDSRKERITSLLQLDWDSLREVINYAAYILPHSKWALEN